MNLQSNALTCGTFSLLALFSLSTPAQSQASLPSVAANHWAKVGVDLYSKYGGNVGIGTTAPASKLDVVGSGNCVISATNSIASNGAAAVCGEATSTSSITTGVYGNCHSDTGRGVFGAARSTTGPALGVYGISYADAGTGVYGWAISPTGLNYGVYGTSSSPQGYAGFFQGRGCFTGDTGFGVANPAYAVDAAGSDLYVIQGTNSIASNGAAAIYGHATSPSSMTIGVTGECQSDMGRGVFGRASNPTGASIGVYGYSAAGGPSYGVFAGGNLGATGVKSFRIDHPLDPQNAYLLHYCTESPEPQNTYSGNATLDGTGAAWIRMPDYFESINRDFRYQLTALGAAMPALHVAERIEDNLFLVSGGEPFYEVSWEVTATRNDLWVRTHGTPSEVQKPEAERGKFQRPELYGLPEEMGVDYRSDAEQP